MVEDVGVRDVIDKAGLKVVFGVLRDPIVEEPANWSRRRSWFSTVSRF
jgi:CarD family transcriptional regulator